MQPLNFFIITALLCLLFSPGASAQANDCDEAGEWYDEGLLLSDNSDKEASYYRRAIDLCPEFIAAYNRLGEVYKVQGKYILSIEAFERARIRALSSNRFSSRSGSKKLFLESVISLGEIYRLQGKYEQAAAEFSKALQMDPEAIAAQNNLQYVYKRMHSYDNVKISTSNLLTTGIFTRIPGMTLPKKNYSIDLQYKQWKQEAERILNLEAVEELTILTPLRSSALFQDDIRNLISPSASDASIKTVILSLRYGITDTFTIGLIPKYFYRSIDVEASGISDLTLSDIYDFGDTELLFKYRFWGTRNKYLSLYTLFNLPTGGEQELLSKNPIIERSVPQEDGTIVDEKWDFKRYVPFGAESWDVTPGIAFTLGLDPFILQSNMQYRFTDGNLIGDEFRFNLATIYRFNPYVNCTMEVNYRWQADVRRRLQAIVFKRQPAFIGPDLLPAGPVSVETHYIVAGGEVFYLSPGLQFTVAPGVRIDMGMQIPVNNQNANWQEEITYQVGITFMSF